MEIVIVLILSLIGAVAGYFAGNAYMQKSSSQLLEKAHADARKIIDTTASEAESQKQEKIEEARQKARNLRSEADKYKAEATKQVSQLRKKMEEDEQQLKQKEAKFNQRAEQIKGKEDELNKVKDGLNQQQTELTVKRQDLDKKQQDLDKKQQDLDAKVKDAAVQFEKLQKERQDLDAEYLKQVEKVAGLTAEEAKQQLIKAMKEKAETEALAMIKDIAEEAKMKANKEAKKVIIQTIQRTAAEHTIENTISVFHLESDDIKGQIIGREGRNIRALEAATGVEIIVDDTPEAIVISGFDPVRREVARLALQRLVTDGRIHPARIEEVVAKTRKQIEQQIVEFGERTVIDLNIHGLHPELVRAVGRMRYRSSYGQNLLQHSIEVAKLCAIMASELGLGPNNVKLVKRAGLLHDIGKVPDEETELSHALLGMRWAEKHKEHPAVCNAIGAHHDEIEMSYIISPIVQACDAISGARPGARREILETYLKRINELETLAQSYDGVEKAYAIQAGRELRVIVESDKVADKDADDLSFIIANKIQTEMQYPGQIKVTVIREKRAVSYAR